MKIVILLSAVWFTVEFLIYSDDLRTSNIVASGPHALELKYNNEFDDSIDENANSLGAGGIKYINDDIFSEKNESVVSNVILSNFNNKDNLNSLRNVNDDSGKHKKLSEQHKFVAKKPASDDNGETIFDIYFFFFLASLGFRVNSVAFFSFFSTLNAENFHLSNS